MLELSFNIWILLFQFWWLHKSESISTLKFLKTNNEHFFKLQQTTNPRIIKIFQMYCACYLVFCMNLVIVLLLLLEFDENLLFFQVTNSLYLALLLFSNQQVNFSHVLIFHYIFSTNEMAYSKAILTIPEMLLCQVLRLVDSLLLPQWHIAL